jgi:hypothetical protein
MQFHWPISADWTPMNDHDTVATLNLESHSTFEHVGHIHCQPDTPRKGQVKPRSAIKPRSNVEIHLKDPLVLVSPRHARTLPFPPPSPAGKQRRFRSITPDSEINVTADPPIFPTLPQPLPRNSDISGQGRARARVSPHSKENRSLGSEAYDQPNRKSLVVSFRRVQAITFHHLAACRCRHRQAFLIGERLREEKKERQNTKSS